MRNREQSIKYLKTITGSAVFAALALASTYAFRIHVQFLTFDAKDSILTLCGMIFGTVPGIAAALVVSLVEMITVSDTGILGLIMNFVSSASFVAVTSLIYRRKRTISSAVAGMGIGILCATAAVLAMDILIIPLYTGQTASDVVALIPALLLPFNEIKYIFSSALVLIFYKPLCTALRSARLIPKGGDGSRYSLNRTTVTVLIVGVCIIALCTAVMFFVFDGSF